jgi:protein phosphatase 1L
MQQMRARIASRGGSRKQSPSPDMISSKGTKLPLIASSATSSNDDVSSSLWSPPRPAGYLYGICSQQGKRPYQEDQAAVRPFINLSSNSTRAVSETHFFGLFDGHAGGRCSQYLAQNLVTTLIEDDAFASNLPLAMKKCFLTVNEQFLKLAEKGKWHDGSTGNVAVIRDNKLTVANVGDCRSVLISNGRPLQMSNDHKPTNPDEQKRIASLGGAVVYCMGVARVNRVLAVSRAFGNRTLRTVIRPDAELMQRELQAGDDFLVMASDGMWDVLRNKDVAEVCYSAYLQRRPQAIADELVHMALARGSMDNVTCIVVNLNDYQSMGSGSSSDNLYNSHNNDGYRSRGASHGDAMDSAMMTADSSGGGGLDSQSIIGSHSLLSRDREASVSNMSAGDDEEENDSFNATSFPYQAAAASSASHKRSNNNQNSNNNNNNSMFHPHDIPNKQRSMGAINARDLPGVVEPTDHFNIRNSRGSFVKAGSTNSMGSNHGGQDSSFAMSLLGSQSEKIQQQLGGGRPLTALDASLLSIASGHSNSNSNSGIASGGNTLFKAPSLNGSSGRFSSNDNNNNSLTQPKLAALRSMRSSNALSNSMPMSSQLQSDSLVVQSRMPLARPSTTMPMRSSVDYSLNHSF